MSDAVLFHSTHRDAGKVDYICRNVTDAESAGAHVSRASDRQRVQHEPNHSQTMAGPSTYKCFSLLFDYN